MNELVNTNKTTLPSVAQSRKHLAKIRGDIPKMIELADFMKVQLDIARKQGLQLAACNEHASLMLEVQAEGGMAIRAAMDAGLMANNKGGDRQTKARSQLGTVLDQGISKNDSSRWQKVAVVLEKDPEWFSTAAAECTSAGRQLTQQAGLRRGQELINEEIGDQPVVVPKGKYSTIVIDPPWPMQKIERECAPNQTAFDYPVMTEGELGAMDLPAAEDCHLWLWTTHKFMPMALRLAPVWGFKYVCAFVWHKPGGFQPFGLPQYNCEFALYCRKGSPKFETTKRFNTCFEGPRGAHSEKPEEFYETIRRVTGGRRLDMFNRRSIKGFTGWGNESE